MASGALGATALASTAFGQSSDDGHRRLRFGNAGQLVVSSAASISVSSTSWDGSQASSSDVSVGPGADYFPVDHLSIGLGTDLDHGVSRGYTADNGVLETTPTDLSVGARFGLSLGISRRVSLWPRLTLGAHRYTETQQTIVRGSLGSATDPAVWPTVTHSGPWMEVRLPVIVSLAPGLFVGAGPRLSQDFAADDVGPYSGAQRTGVSVAIELGGYCGGGVAEAEPDDDGRRPRSLCASSETRA